MAFGFKAKTAPDGTWTPSIFQRVGGILEGQTVEDLQQGRAAKVMALENAKLDAGIDRKLSEAFGALTGAVPVQAPQASDDGVSPPASTSPRSTGRLPSIQDLGPILALAVKRQRPGAKDLVDLLSKAAPDIGVAGDGTAFDKRDPGTVGRRFGNPTVVNGRIVNLNDDKNLDAYIPEPPVKGAVPVYGEQGKAGPPIGWKMPDGALQAIASTEAATSGGRAAGQAPFQVVTIQMPDGSTQQMPLSQFVGMGGGAGGSGGGRPAPTSPAQGGAMGRSQSPADAEYAKKQAIAAQGRYQKIQEDGAAAPGKIANFGRIAVLLDGVEGGKFSELGLDIAQAANSLGFKIDPKLANKEAAKSLSDQIALGFKDQLPGPLSNPDREFLIKMAPGLSQSAQGRKLIIDAATKVYQRQADVARMARAWQQKYGRLDAVNPATRKGFDDNLAVWVEQNRLFPGK